MTTVRNYLPQIRKFIAGVVGFVLVLITQGVLSGDAVIYVQAGIAALTLWGLYWAPNAPSPKQMKALQEAMAQSAEYAAREAEGSLVTE